MYLFAITAFDEAGDYDPVFDANKNLLFFRVATPGTLGPRITMYNESFNYSYPSGGFSTDSSREVRLELPADAPVTFHWFAQAALGLDVTGYRWVLDPVSLDDEKPRKNKNDTGHWSPWSLSTTSAALGVFHGQAASKEHLFYVEAMDDLGEISLGIIRFHLVQVRANRQLLIVDDTRFNPDQFVGGSVGPPKGTVAHRGGAGHVPLRARRGAVAGLPDGDDEHARHVRTATTSTRSARVPDRRTPQCRSTCCSSTGTWSGSSTRRARLSTARPPTVSCP
mgnify:CR=1 FL=1